MPTSSSAVQHILNEWTLYIKPEQSRRALVNILGNGLLTAEGETHRRQRKVLAPAFATSYIRDIIPIFSAKADELVDVIRNALPTQSEKGVEVFTFLSRATLDIIGAAGKSRQEGSRRIRL
jgi:cytochrome P450